MNMELDNDEQTPKRIKLEVGDRPLNFAINPDEFDIQCVKKPKAPRDPMSHRIIEKRRRDRMNNCLADLSRLIPSNYLKQGQGRIEKTEIIEMASKHIRHLQNLNNFHGGNTEKFQVDGKGRSCCEDKFYMGFKECEDEALRYLIEIEGRDIKDQLCSNMVHHLDQVSKRYLNVSDENGNTQSESKREEVGNEDSKNYLDNQNMSGQVSGQFLDSHLSSQVIMGTQIENSNTETITNRNQSNFLRKLLLPKDQNSDGNGPSSHISSGNESCVSMLSLGTSGNYRNGRNDEDQSVSSGGSQYMDKILQDSDQSSACGSNGSSSREYNVYKFKHNITKRFSQEEKKDHPTPPSDSSSSSSKEDEKEKVKRKFPRHKSRPASSDSTPYPSGSEYSNSPCEFQKLRNLYSHGNRNDNNSSLNIPLPAFVLSPDGTHYMPVSIHPSHLENVFSKKETSSVATYHPISIPVNFMGPYVSMRGRNSLESTNREDCGENMGSQSNSYAVAAK